MDPQRPIYTQGVRTKRVGLIYAMAVKSVRNRRRDYQKWIRGVRFTPRWFEKKEVDRFDAFGTYLKTSPRDHQKWIRGVRFTPRGSEKNVGMI